MESWETPYMQKLARIATQSGGTVLEVGFGMGISSRFIQRYKVQHHIIIEMNNVVAQRATEFAKRSARPVTVLEGFWEDVIRKIPDDSVDGILFDTYPLRESEVHKNHFPFFRIAYRKLKPGGTFTYYSDEIEDFHTKHIEKLVKAGFKRRNIDSVVVAVRPPKHCLYWKSNKILAPIIKK